MEIDPKTYFQDLNFNLNDDQNGPYESSRLLDSLNRNFTEEQVDSPLIDIHLLYIFHKSDGLLNFIEKSAKKKIYKRASVKAVEILYATINNFPFKVPEHDIMSIYTLTTKIINSDADSSVRVKLLDLLQMCMGKYDGCTNNKVAKGVYEAFLKAIQHALMQKHTDTVKGKEMSTLGFFAKRYPYYVAEPKKIQTIMWMNFEKQMAQPNKVSQYILEGFFDGFRYFLDSFPLNVESNEGKKISDKLYKTLKTLVVTKERLKLGNRAALLFFSNIIDMYKEKLFGEYKFWHDKLLVWLTFGPEDRKVGVTVLRALFQSVAQVLDEKEGPTCREVVEYFNNYSRSALERKESSKYEKHLAIFCLRQFSYPSHKHLPSEQVTTLFLAIMRNFEETYILNYDSESEESEYMPDFVQTVAQFIKFKKFTTGELFCLQRAVINMVKSFHRLPILHFGLVVDSFIMTLFHLKEGQHFDIFLENVVYQGIVWTCSHQHITNAAYSEETSQKIVTVRNYFPLWNGILKVVSNTSYDKHKLYLEDRKYLLERTLKEIVKTLLVLVNKLNVAVRLKEEDDVVTDLEQAYEVDKSNDYAIFLNVVDFYREIFDNVNANILRSHICRIISHLVEKCLKYPLVSGFYKLLSYALRIAKKLELFSSTTVDVVNNCQETLNAFLTILLNKMAEFKDELAISCLQVLLETPVAIIEVMLELCVAPFVNIFEMGRSYLPLAQMGLETLELWQENVDPAVLDPVLVRIVPSLDSYLRSKSLRGLAQMTVDKRKTQRALKKRKVIVELEPELVRLQRKILCFVGKQNLRILRAYIFSEDTGPRNLLCGQEMHLKVTLPYEDLQVDIYLDTFVPRTVDLALHCSDRKTRITACELLQASVMVLLGKARPMNQSGLLDLNNMLKTIAMPLLRLSSDVDQVVRQIFAPLFLQLVHWYTSPSQRRGAHSAIIIETLMEGITHPTNSSLRDFSGKCIREFVEWTMKQSDEQNLARDPVNIKILVKNMRFFSTHPDSAKKLGAALIFNNIYREMREEEEIISIFWLEILHVFVQSLNAVTAFEESTTVSQIKRSIKNLLRVFVEKPSVFRRADAKRRVPNDLKDGLLKDVAVWLLEQTSSKSFHCREASMELFISIAPLASQKKANLKTFIRDNFDGHLVDLYSNSLLEFQKLKDGPCGNVDALLKWMRSLLCVLDGYNFVARNNLADIVFENNNLFGEIQVFLERLQASDMVEALNIIAEKNWTLTTIDKDHFDSLKSACILSIFKFFNTILLDEVLFRKSTSVWTAEFWQLISNAVFQPRLLGLSEVLHPGYEDQLRVLVDNVSRKLPQAKQAELNYVLRSVIFGNWENDIDLRRHVGWKQRSVLQGMIFLRSTNLNRSLLIENYANGVIHKLMSNFQCNADGNVVFVGEIQDTTFSYINSSLDFALGNNEEFELLIDRLHSQFIVRSLEYTREKSFGAYFLDTFGEKVLPVISEKFNRFLTLSLAKDDMKATMVYVDSVLNLLIKEKSLRTHNKEIVLILEQHWHQFQIYFETDRETMNTGLEYLKLLNQLDNLHSLDIQDWLLQYLMKSDGSKDLEIFNLLVCMVTEDSINSENFKPALQILLGERIILESTDASTTKVNKMLSYLPLVKETSIFQFLTDIYLKTSPTTDVSPLLTEFIVNADRDFQQKILEIVYDLSCDHQTSFDGRYKITTKFLPAIFHGCDIKVFENFFVKHIKTILEKLTGRDLEIRIPHFVLTEILFVRIPIGSEDRDVCAITNAAGTPKLLRELLAPALKAFEVPIDGSALLRKYKCSAYNALASMVSNSLKLKEFYNKLFMREVNDADVLWHGIVDTTTTYAFPVDFDTIPKQRNILVNIRDELKRSRAADGPSKSLKYLESQRLFDSSLSEDVTKFDFSGSVLRDNAGDKRKGPAGDSQRTVLQLDATEVNDHECMGTVCGLVQHVFDTGISDLPREDEEDVELPKWMDGIRTILLDEKTHNNVKIFLVKVIDNMIHIFTPYSKWFLEPLMLFVTNKCTGGCLNYFVTDVLIILSKWASTSTTLSEKEEKIASNLLKFLIENLSRERIDIFKYNLDIVKMIVESWKHHLVVPNSTILRLLTSNDTSEIIGVNVTSILLANSLNCWEEGREMEFLEMLLKIMRSPKKEVFRPCSETVGLMLNVLNGDQFTSKVDVALKKINQEYEKYVLCLEGIVRHFPQIIDSFHVLKLINPLNQVPDSQKVVHLRIICKRVELSLDILAELNDFKIVDWDRLLESANLEIQIVALEIIKKCITIFVTYDNFKSITKTLTRNVVNPNALYRSCLYDICIEVYNLKRDDLGACRELLILGLVDADADNNEKVMKFWSDNTSIPSDVIHRFPFLLSEMYKPKIEGQFLGFVTYFLVCLAGRSENDDTKLFEHPLEDCDFEAYQLQTDWRMQHPSVVPMFAETLQSYEASAASDDAADGFRLRQTQDAFEFAPTQSFREQQLSKFTDLNSSLAISFDGGIKNPNTMILSQKYRLPRRRFLKDKAKISISHAHYEVKKQVEKVQQRIDTAIEKEKKVTIYRNYRKGDFPDIQITLSSVLKPLQILALHDHEVSKILFTEIFKGLVDKVEDNQIFVETITRAIRNIFTTSTQYNPNLFGALLDILLRHKDKIPFDPQTVVYVSQESGLVAVGALLLEEYLNSYDSLPSPSKIGVGQNDRETIYWVQLAELYRELEEWDMVRTIFLEKLNCKEAIQQALKFESESMFRNAQLLYAQLIETDLSPERKNFYYDSYFRCFANLGEWEELPKAINSVVGGNSPWHQLWDNGWQQQKLLPWFIKAQVRNALFTQEWDPVFLRDLNECLLDANKNEYLRGHFSEELCTMWLCQKDVPAANIYLKECVRNFLDDWQLLNPMFQSLRFQKLLRLQNVVETEEFLDIYDHLLDDPEVSLTKYAKRLEKSFNDVLPSLMLNETRWLYRGQFIDLLVDKISKVEEVDFGGLAKELRLTKIRMDIGLIDAATAFGNYYVARKYYKKYLGKVNPRLQMAYGNIACLKARISETAQTEANWSLEGMVLLRSVAASTQDQMILLSCSTNIFDVCNRLCMTLSSNPDVFHQCIAKLEEMLGCSISNTNEIQSYAWKQLKITVEKCHDESMDCDGCEDRSKHVEISKAYVKLAHFLRDRAQDDDDVQGNIIIFVLRAMKMNSSEARQLFPCILKQSEIGGKYKDMFVEETDKIPTWMFLGWIPQLLSSVDSSQISVVSKIVMRIAETYPQSIMYPYRLSRTNYDISNANVKLLTDRLDDLLLKDEMISKFLQALSFVSVPSVILRYYISKMLIAENIVAAKFIQESVKTVIFYQKHSSNAESMQGNMFKQIEPFNKEFSKNLGTSMAKMKENLKLIDVRLSAILSNSKTKYSQLLKEYCPWLANFSAEKLNMELEIPGQYDGKKMPLTQHHVKISGFCPNVSVMKSLRKPIKVTILGADTKEYPFLVKFGEDIRQDQRIEQLFSLMNDIFRSDAICANNGLDILTYQVIPLTQKLGIIQWIDDTEPLSEFMKKSLKTEKAREEFTNNKIGEKYARWLCVGADNLHVYGKSAVKYNRNKVIPFYKSLVNEIPLDILKTSFWSLSVNTENYIALRANFIKTYAAMCVGQWLLGIGDRHLNNSLVCLRSGKVLGIDFGHAFGTATQILPVPELVPFRLTPHLVSLMGPLKERGQFRDSMIACLRALRANGATLLATMDVFVEEPSLDWIEHARRFESGDGTDSAEWYPSNKVAQCRRKLAGVNCADVFVEDLIAGTRVSDYTEAYVKLVMGDKENDLRSRLGDVESLSVEQQVDVLIDHATDSNLLGRMYAGWMPWV